MTVPQAYPRHPDDSIVPLTWAEAGVATEPSSGRKSTGFANDGNDAPPVAEWNWLSREPMRVLRAVFSRYIDGSEGLYSSWLVSNGVWTDNGVGPLDGFLSDSLGVDSKVADVWLEPVGATGAVRVQVRVRKADPHPFPATRDTYVFVPVSSIAPPIAEESECIFLDVPHDDPAPATPAGTVPVWRVRTDASGIIDQEVLIPQRPALKDIYVELVRAAGLEVSGDATVSGGLTVAGNISAFGNATVANSVTVGGSVTVSGTTTLTDALSAADATFSGLVSCTNDVEVGGDLEATGAITALSDLTVKGTTLCEGEAYLDGITRVRNQLVILGANGGSISSDPSADLTWNGVASFLGRLNIPQTGTTQGDISRDGLGRLLYRDSVGNKFVHSSETGYVRKAGQTETGTVTPGNPVTGLSQVAITPFAAGDVTVTVLGHFTWGSDASSVRILLRDHGTMTTINGGGTGTPEYPPVGALARSRSCGATIRYTLPSAAARVFSVTLTAAGADIDYQDLVLVVETCQS